MRDISGSEDRDDITYSLQRLALNDDHEAEVKAQREYKHKKS